MNPDGRLDANVVRDAIATTRQVIDDYEPFLETAARAPKKGERARG